MKTRHLLVPALLVIAGCAQAADKPVEDLLAKMRNAYRAVKTATFVVKAESNTNNGSAEFTTTFAFMHPGNIVASMVRGDSGTQELVLKTDSKQMELVGRGSLKFNVDDFERVLQGSNLESLNFWDSERQLSTGPKGNMKASVLKIVPKETWKKQDWIVLEETAKDQNVFVRYFVDPKTYLVMRTVVFQPIGGKAVIQDARVEKLQLNGKLDEKQFKLGAAG